MNFEFINQFITMWALQTKSLPTSLYKWSRFWRDLPNRGDLPARNPALWDEGRGRFHETYVTFVMDSLLNSKLKIQNSKLNFELE